LRAVLSVQVAFSIAVLFLAGLLVTSFRKLMHVDLGFAKERVVLFDLSGKGPAAPNGPLLKRVRQIPGVQAAGLSGMALMSGAFGPHIAPAIRLPGRDWDPARPLYMAVSAGFFETMRIRLLAGREFTVGDSGAAIVNRAFARRYFGGDEAVGRRFEQQGDDPQPVSLTIVGVVADARYNNLREPIGPTVYTSLATVGGRGSSTLEVRTATDPRGMADALRRRIEDGGASLKVTGMTLQSARIDDTVISERLLAVLGGLFAAIALLLVTVGLYGVIRYTAARRQKEVGIRIALGARSGAVLRLVWSDVALPVVAGLAAGIAGGRAAARFLETLLYEVRPTDAASLAIPVVCILLTCAAAALPPAWRSARTDPMTVLRHE
jgi:predicted permease